MKIAISASTSELNGFVDPRFGRCAYFLIVDPETMAFEAVENPYVSASGGAGIQAAQLLAGKSVQAVLTGNCGPNAFQTLTAAGVEVITGVSGKVEEVVRSYASGAWQAAKAPDVPPHFGLAGRPGSPQGGGTGRPRGGQATGTPERPQGSVEGPGSGPVSTEEELRLLREQAQDLRRHLDHLSERMAALEKKRT